MRYGVQGNGITQTMSIEGTTSAILSGLMAFTTYFIEVAAVNTINTGVYSDPLFIFTGGKLYSSY